MFDWAFSMPLTSIRKRMRKCNFETICPKFSINLSVYFFKKIVVLKITVIQFQIANASNGELSLAVPLPEILLLKLYNLRERNIQTYHSKCLNLTSCNIKRGY